MSLVGTSASYFPLPFCPVLPVTFMGGDQSHFSTQMSETTRVVKYFTYEVLVALNSARNMYEHVYVGDGVSTTFCGILRVLLYVRCIYLSPSTVPTVRDLVQLLFYHQWSPVQRASPFQWSRYELWERIIKEVCLLLNNWFEKNTNGLAVFNWLGKGKLSKSVNRWLHLIVRMYK